eukprot:Partr_v1_DN26996_c0_g1_i2_m6933 putative Phosphatidylinositol glycan anchor biosynthesis, class T
MHFCLILATLLGGLLPLSAVSGDRYNYTEHLKLQQLHDGRVFMDLEFMQRLTLDPVHPRNWLHFPRDMGEMMGEYGLKSLSLSLTQGQWQDHRWKVLSEGHDVSRTSGAELHALFDDDEATLTSTAVDARWKRLTHTLSGLFCASLHFIDKARTAVPHRTFGNGAGHHRYGSLPRENTCTENLTPWVKQLPCGARSGLGSLLNAYRLFNANYHSMRIDLAHFCDGDGCHLRLVQRLVLVVDPMRLTGTFDWSLSSLLDRNPWNKCPLASSSDIALDIPDDIQLDVVGAQAVSSHDGAFKRHTYQVSGGEFDVIVKNVNVQRVSTGLQQVLVDRHLTGYGEEFGGVSVKFRNYGDSAVDMVYFDMLPWFMRLHIHTLTLKVVGNDTTSGLLRDFDYQAAIDRERPSVLEFTVTVPAASTVHLSLQFQKTLLRYTEYPPDANRGFDIGGAIVLVLDVDGTTKRRISTSNLLLTTPTPDFSMPYNVITLTCSALALYFGNLYNAMVRPFRRADADPSGLKGVILKFIRKLTRRGQQ